MQSRLEFAEFGDGLGAADVEFVALTLQSGPLLLGGADLLAEPAELLVDRRDRGVGLIERRQCLLGGVLAGSLLGDGSGQRGAQFGGQCLGGGEFGSGLVDLACDFQRAGPAVRPTVHPARTDEVAVGGDGAQFGPGGHQVQGRREVGDHGHTGQHRRQRSAQPRRSLDHFERPAGTVGQSRGVLAGRRRPVGQYDRGPAAVGVLERPHRRAGRAEIVGGDSVGCGAEHRGDRGLVAGLDLDQLRDRTEKPCAAAVLDQPCGTVFAVQAHREGIDARQ